MTTDQKASFIFSQAVCAMIEAMGMNAENQDRIRRGLGLAYTEEQFTKVIDDHGIGHNAVISFFQE